MTDTVQRGPSGMFGFTLVWAGQVVSLVSTAMTQFALAIWAYELTGQATALALVGFFAMAPMMIFSPLAGALVDRYDRKLMMMLSDIGAGISTLGIFLLYSNGGLEIWHLYVAAAWASVFQAFQFPAYSAAVSLMIPKDQYTRANSMMEMAESFSGIFAPFLAGAAIAVIGIGGVLLLDVATFIFAVAILSLIYVPSPPPAKIEHKPNTLREDMVYGFKYIWQKRPLLGLLTVFMTSNFLFSLAGVTWVAMLMARSGNNEFIVGMTQTAAGLGGLAGGILVTWWGGFKRQRVRGVLLGMVISAVGLIATGLGQVWWVWLVAGFLFTLPLSLTNGSSQAIWQSKTEPAVQGRVFATRRLIAQFSAPIATLLAGPLVDRVLEPALREGGALVPLLGGVMGVGPGAGNGLLLVVAGVLVMLTQIIAWSLPFIRNLEDKLPDHTATPPRATDSAEAAPATVSATESTPVTSAGPVADATPAQST
jgi:MFS transporter, DHA3 family, macrolide efflux protein